jgi:tetratricopeptide (TPR) repeat protein
MIPKWMNGLFPPAEPAPAGSWRLPSAAAAVLAALVLALYWPAVDFRMMRFDDYYYAANSLISGGLDGKNILRIFTELPEEDLFIPLSQLSLMADVELFGMSARGFHFTNMALHALDMAILLLLLWRMTGSLPKSAFAAAFVALHPLRVESVAWITERKDVLSVLFLLLSMACYLRFVRGRKLRWYAALLACSLLGMLAKPMAVTLPVLLLLLDYWPLGRMREAQGEGDGSGAGRRFLALAAEKLPLLALSAIFSAITLRMQSGGAIHHEETILSRIEHALASPLFYLYQTAWPADLAFRFFQTTWTRFSGSLIPAALAFAAITALALRARRAGPCLLFGWAWFLVALFPSSGIVPAGVYWVADRFTYVPHVGVAVALAWGAGSLDAGRLRRGILPGLGVAVLALLAATTRHQLGYWKDGAAFFGHGMPYNRGDIRYASQYIQELIHMGDLREARTELERLLPSAKDKAYGTHIQMNHLSLLEAEGDWEGAIRAAREYLAADPDFWKTRMRLADNLMAAGRYREALEEFRRVLPEATLTPRQRRHALEGAGLSAFASGLLEEALSFYSEALRGDPLSASLHFKMGQLLEKTGRGEEAFAHYSESIRIDPSDPATLLATGELLLKAGKVEPAALLFQEVARLYPNSAEALYSEGRVLEAAGMGGQARPLYEKGLATKPLFSDTHNAIRERMGLPAAR